jgi:hypothetical protein
MKTIKLTRERCEEIVRQCQEKASYGPWVDQMGKVMTREEQMEVMELWCSMPGHTSFYDTFCRFWKGRVNFVEITEEHVGKMLFPAFGRHWRVSDFIGRILKQDVGKRVYKVADDLLQVENEEQRTERLRVPAYKQFQTEKK